MNTPRLLFIRLFFAAVLLVLAGCESMAQENGDIQTGFGGGADTQASAAGPTAATAAPSQDSRWDLSALDTARSVSYMTETEKDVILEVNKARANPALYGELYIKPMLALFSGRDYTRPGRITIRTNEGAAAVRECLSALAAQKPRPPLSPNQALALGARDHVKDTGPKGIVGHQGSDGSDPMARVRRYAKNLYVGENVSYGPEEAREIVIQFLVDDGVSSRGHRENIMRDTYASIGVSIGSHKTYGFMCVMDFALAPQ